MKRVSDCVYGGSLGMEGYHRQPLIDREKKRLSLQRSLQISFCPGSQGSLLNSLSLPSLLLKVPYFCLKYGSSFNWTGLPPRLKVDTSWPLVFFCPSWNELMMKITDILSGITCTITGCPNAFFCPNVRILVFIFRNYSSLSIKLALLPQLPNVKAWVLKFTKQNKQAKK